jgi:iron complex outermembrane receptor protein
MRIQKRRLWLASASMATVGFVGLANQALAQQAAPSDSEAVSEVVVTGFRSSLDKALNVKRSEPARSTRSWPRTSASSPTSTSPNPSSAFPACPGPRRRRRSQISVRGLGPQFTRVRINGMEALTTAGGSDAGGGTNRGRSFDFNVFASDLFNAIVVRKTAVCDRRGSLGATVDLRTARPFDHKGFTSWARPRPATTTWPSRRTRAAHFMISNTFADDTFGALLSVAYSKRKLKDEGSSTVRWATGNAFTPGFRRSPNGAGLPTTANPAAGQRRLPPALPALRHLQGRPGAPGRHAVAAMAALGPTEVALDMLYADFKGTREERYLEAPSFSVGGACTAANVNTSCGIAQTHVVSSVIDSKNTMVAGTFNNVDLRVEDRFDELDTKFTQIGLSGDRMPSPTTVVKVNGLIGHSKSDHQNPVQTTVQFDQFNVQGYSYDYRNGRLPVIGYGSAKLTRSIVLGADPDPHPAAVGGQHLRCRPCRRQLSLNLGVFKLSGGARLQEVRVRDHRAAPLQRHQQIWSRGDPRRPSPPSRCRPIGQVINFAGFDSLIPERRQSGQRAQPLRPDRLWRHVPPG